jgi:hypothetical protein
LGEKFRPLNLPDKRRQLAPKRRPMSHHLYTELNKTERLLPSPRQAVFTALARTFRAAWLTVPLIKKLLFGSLPRSIRASAPTPLRVLSPLSSSCTMITLLQWLDRE